MSKLPAVRARKVLKALKKAGFESAFQSGSHLTLKNSETGNRVTVPIHPGKDLKKGTLRAIIRQSGLTVDEFLRWM